MAPKKPAKPVKVVDEPQTPEESLQTLLSAGAGYEDARRHTGSGIGGGNESDSGFVGQDATKPSDGKPSLGETAIEGVQLP